MPLTRYEMLPFNTFSVFVSDHPACVRIPGCDHVDGGEEAAHGLTAHCQSAS